MENKDKRIPKYCFEIPLSGVDYIYQSSFSHSPVVVMKPLVQPLERISEETRPTGRKSYGYSITKIRMAISKIFKDRNIEEGDWIVTDLCHLIAKEKHKSFNDGEEYAKEKVEVEPLQNGEREEIWKNLRDIIIQRPPNYILPSYVEVSEERIMDYIMDLLSQSKKEGIEEALEEINEILGTNIKYVNGEYKVVFRELSKLTTK